MSLARSLPLASILVTGVALVAGGCSSSPVSLGRDTPGPDGSACSAGQAGCAEAGAGDTGARDTGANGSDGQGPNNPGGDDGGVDSQGPVCATQCIDITDIACPLGMHGITAGCENHPTGNDGSVYVCCVPDNPSGEAGAPEASTPPDGSTLCHLDPTGTFTFHVHNGGTRMLSLALGCGGSLPIVVDTPSGTRPIGPGPEDVCEYKCDWIYAGMVQGGACSDCGPGSADMLGPGMTADIQWDRRSYVETMTDPQCSGGSTQPCAFGTRVAPAASQSGVLTVCTSTGVFPGNCGTTDTVMFTVDTTKGEATIEVP